MSVTEKRLAVVDLGSNSFRLVEFTWVPGQWWKRTDEIHEPVRIGEGLDEAGVLGPEPMARALETVELYAHFCRATGIEDVRAVATSAIRDATNRDEFLRRAAARRAGADDRGGGVLRLPGGGQLDDAERRRGARPRRRLDAAHPRRGPQGDRHALVAARRRAHDRALPRPRARQAQAAEGAARAHRRLARGRAVAERRRRAGRHRRHGPQPGRRGRAGRGAAVVRRPGLPAAQGGARRAGRRRWPTGRPPSAPTCPASSPSAPT